MRLALDAAIRAAVGEPFAAAGPSTAVCAPSTGFCAGMAHDAAGTRVLLIGALIGALGKERILRFGCGCGPKVWLLRVTPMAGAMNRRPESLFR